VHLDPQIQHLGLIREHDTGHIGAVRQPVPMWHFGTTKANVTTSIGRTGEHTREVLGQFGISDTDIAQLAAEGVIAWPTD
jgi:crotonobetainyl-CoA:carnitine CoA-transferase CaiB-like acyl-CoA transferase